MGSKLIKQTGPLHFVWITDYYDFPITGTCMYNKELCKFEWDQVYHEGDTTYNIYNLTWKEKIVMKFRQTMFELSIGRNWTYNGPKRSQFRGRGRPRWLRNIMYKLYYKIKNNKR